MELRELGRTGLKVSVLGYGASPLGGEFGPIDEAEGIRSVHRALDLGINFFDTAPFYGRTRSETVLGQALEGRRDRVVLASKVGRYGKTEFDFRPETVLNGLDESLRRLRTDHIDVVYVHDIEFGEHEPIASETIPALERARQAGKVGAIGVSGLPLAVLRRMIEAVPLDLVLSYSHYHLADTRLVEELLPAVEARGIGLVNAAPLAMGLLTQPGPPDWHPAPDTLKQACRSAAEFCRGRGVDLADLALAFALQAPRVHSTVVGMPSVSQVERNVEASRRPADPTLLGEILEILRPVSGQTWPSGRDA